MNKYQAMEQLRKAIQMFAATLTDEQAMEIATVYSVYEVGKNYKSGEMFTYGVNNVGDPQLYRVVSDHTSQADWIPSATPALYTPIGLTEEGYTIWSQPSGAHDAFNAGDEVEHNGEIWVSDIDSNVWEPGVYGWTKKV